MAESADWLANRKEASLDSSLLREKGVTPAWTMGSETRGKAYLVGDRKGKETFSPNRPPHARNETPHHVAQLSSVGVQVQSEVHGRLESAPAFNFYGPYGDAWAQEHIDKLKGDRGSKAHGLFAASSVFAQPGVGGTTVRAPPQVPGPGQYVASADAAHVQACGAQVLSTQRSAVAVGLPAPSVLDEKQAARLAAHAAQHRRTPGGLSWPARGPTATTGLGAKVANATLGVRQPSSTLANAPTFTFTDKAKRRYNSNPGPGGGGVRGDVAGSVGLRAFEGKAHVMDAYPTANGLPLVTDTTLGRVATRPNAPVAVMASRDPKHPAKPAKPPEVASAKDDYRSNPNRWSQRVGFELNGAPTEARAAVYSSFGGQAGSVQRSAAAYTMRGLHANHRKPAAAQQAQE